MNWISATWLNRRHSKIREVLPNHGLCLDVGSGGFPIFNTTVNLDFDAKVRPSVCADARCLPFRSGVFDQVYCSEAIEHFNEHDVFYDEVKKILREKGKLLVTSPQDSNLWDFVWWVWSRTIGRKWFDEHDRVFNVEEMGKFFDLILVDKVNYFLNLVIGEKV